jgi:hypothetical protein
MSNIVTTSYKNIVDSLTAVSGLFLWNDASDLNTIKYHSTSGKISAWNDKSGGNRHFIQPNTGNQPSYLTSGSSVGGRPAVHFQSSNQTYMQNIASDDFNSIQSGFTFFTVMHLNSDGYTIISQSSNNTLRRRFDFGGGSNGMTILHGPGDGYSTTFTNSTNLNSKSLFVWVAKDTSTVDFYIDTVKNTVNNVNLQFTGTTTSNLFMGDSQGFDYYIEATTDSEFTEVALFNRTLENFEIIQIENYFIKKYSNISISILPYNNSNIATKKSNLYYPTSAIAYWGFDNMGLYDSTDNNNNNQLYLTGNAFISSGLIKNCAVISNNSYFHPISTFDFSGDFAISVWVNPTSVPNYRSIIVSPSNTGGHGGLQLYINDGSDYNGYPFIGFDSPNYAGPYYGTAHINLNQWNHVVLTRKSNNIRTYINGVLDQNRTDTNDYSCAINIGGNNYNQSSTYMVGGIDEMAIYHNGLSPSDVSTLYNGNSGYSGSNLYKNIINFPIGAMAYWSLNNSSWLDSTGHGYTLTNNGGVTTTTGILSDAALFSGSDQYLSNNSFSITSGTPFSISSWFKGSIYNDEFLFSGGDVGDLFFGFLTSNSFGIGRCQVAWDHTYSTSFNSSLWYHAVCTYDGSTVKLYLNGVNVYTNTTSNAYPVTSKVYLGCSILPDTSVGYFFTGAIDETGIWNKALTDSEVSTLYNIGQGFAYGANLAINSQIITTQAVVLFPTNGLVIQLDASTYSGSGATWNDMSGNNYNATLYNSPTYDSGSGGEFNLNTSNYIITPDSSSKYSSTSGSVFVWFYPTSNGQIITELGQTTPNTGWHDSQIEMHSDGTIHFSVWEPYYSNKLVSPQKSFNQWYLLGFTYDETTFTAYVNDQIIGSTSMTRLVPWNNGFGLFYGINSTDQSNMGVYSASTGKIGGFYTYNRNLTKTDIVNLYYSTKTRYGV